MHAIGRRPCKYFILLPRLFLSCLRCCRNAYLWTFRRYNSFKTRKSGSRENDLNGELAASVASRSADMKDGAADHSREHSWIPASSKGKGKHVRVDVHVEVVTDGPVKVLRLIEGGEREAKNESNSNVQSKGTGQRQIAFESDLHMEISLGEIGISLVDSRPRELLYLLVGLL